MHCSNVSSSAASAYQRVDGGSRKASGTEGTKTVDRCGTGDLGGSDGVRQPHRTDEARPPRNPLVAAMMEAIKSLVPSAASGSTDAVAVAASPVAATGVVETKYAAGPDGDEPIIVKAPPIQQGTGKDAAAALKEAAYAFAHELFQALKAAGESSGVAAPKQGNSYGPSKGYGDLTQALERLAQKVAPKPADVKSSPPALPAPSTGPVSAKAPLIEPTPYTPTPEALTTVAPEGAVNKTSEFVARSLPGATTSPVTINISISFGGNAPVAAGADDPSSTEAESPLLSAFKKLMLALNPGSASTPSTGADAKSPAQMLQGFLEQIAKSLQGDAAAQAPVLPAQGSLINLTA